MLFNNRKSFITSLILILALIGQMFSVAPVQAAMPGSIYTDKSISLLQKNTVNSVSKESGSVGVPQDQVVFPTVVTTSPKHGDVLLNNPYTLSVQFSTNMLANGTAFAVNKPANYLLVEDGADGQFQTTSCTSQLAGDDTFVPINRVSYNSANFTSTLTIYDWLALNQANYQLLVCASTRITDLSGNRLNDGVDTVIRFVVIKDLYLSYSNYGGGDGKSVGIGDFNHDGLTDVVMTTSSEVLVYLKNSEGDLTTPVVYATGPDARSLAVGDFNNDGWDDVVTSGFISNTISVFLQQSDGTFAARVTYTPYPHPETVEAGDITGDGLVDIVVPNYDAHLPSLNVFVQNTNGGLDFVSYNATDSGFADLAIGDVNNDGRNDVVKMNTLSDDPDLSLYQQNTSGTLDTPIPYSLGCNCGGRAIDIGDVTGDGLSDVVISYGGNRPNSKIAVVAQGQDGSLQLPIFYDAYDIPESVEIADVNQDGELDILVLHGGWKAVSVFIQKNGAVQPYVLYTFPNINSLQPKSLAVGDINQDGATDIAIAGDYGLTVFYYREKPAPQVIMGGNAKPVDGEELGAGASQLTVQFDRQMMSDDSSSSANNPSNYLLVEDGLDNNFQTNSCAGGLSGDDALISVDSITYDTSKYFSTLSINGGAPLGVGSYRLLACGTSIEDANGVKLNGGLSDTSMTFTVRTTLHTISGNAGIAGAVLSYTDGGSRTVIADGIGDYSFKVSENWSGTVIPTWRDYTFLPASRTYEDVTSDKVNENYTAVPPTYTISGNVGLSGVSIEGSGLYDPAHLVLSDSNGNYSITVPYGWSGYIRPYEKNHRFSPDRWNYVNVVSDIPDENYTSIPNPYTISGNTGVGEVSIQYTLNSSTEIATSDENGNYSFTVWENWSGIVTPSKPGYLFTPVNEVFSNVQSNQLGQDFTAQRVYLISGNAGIAGAILNYTDGESKAVYADELGDYSIQLPVHWSGTIVPSKEGYVFSPFNYTYTDLVEDQTNQNYTAAPTETTFVISGNTGVGAVNLSYSGGGTTSDENGSYSFIVPYGWSGALTPYKYGCRFTPTERNYRNTQSDQPNQDFAAECVYTISGNAGVESATLSYIENGTPKTVTANSNGYYSFQVPEHWSGVITPSKPGRLFSPASRTYNDVMAHQSLQNYTTVIAATNLNDSGPGSLRQAIADASSGSTIYFDPSLAGQTITLLSPLGIGKSLTIDGSGLDPRVEISGNGTVLIFSVDPRFDAGRDVKLQSLVLKNGHRAIGIGGGNIFIEDVSFMGNSAPDGNGGAISSCCYNTTATITRSNFISNSAQNYGGAIHMEFGSLNVQSSTFMNNSSGSVGGAISIERQGPYTFEDNTFINNSASSGGAIRFQSVEAPVVLRRNLFSGNNATRNGGAIFQLIAYSAASFTFENNTFYANQANEKGGAVLMSQVVSLKNNTFSDNRALQGASLYVGRAYLYNNILANNLGGGECYAVSSGLVSGASNLIEDASPNCGATMTGDPMLGSLADHGGSTKTMALDMGSPAIDVGNPENCLFTDQRGMARPLDGNNDGSAICDLGAYEFGYFTISGNAGVAGATLSYFDGVAKTVTADNNGDYLIGVRIGWSGMVTPYKPGYVFSPASKTYSNVIADHPTENYTATVTDITFTISGNAGVAGATLSYEDETLKTVVADENGDYSFTVPYYWIGTVTPTKADYQFVPGNIDYFGVQADWTAQDYAAIALMTISGNAGIGWTTLNYVDEVSRVVIANADGNYAIQVPVHWSGVVTPTKTAYAFSPANKTYTDVTLNMADENYTAAPATYKISGNVGLSNVSVKYSSSSGPSHFVLSDINGDYSITVSYGWSGHVSPSENDHGFSPSGRDYVNVTSDLSDQDYSPISNPYTISGNTGVGEVLVRYPFYDSIRTVTSDDMGNYSFNVYENWTGTVTPDKQGYRFAPASRNFSNVQSNQPNQDFIAQRVHLISGSTGLAGAILNYTDGSPKTVIADGQGNYSIQVPEHWSGTIMPSKPGYLFTPYSRSYTDVVDSLTAQNYLFTTGYIITGNAGVAGATMNYIDGAAKSVLSDNNGIYTITVPKYWSGTITPSKPDVIFEPVDRTYNLVNENRTLQQDYTATITVTTNADNGTGSLRQAITDASSGATIHFSSTLAGQTINLIAPLTFKTDLNIDGSNLTPRLEINGGGAVRIFEIFDLGNSGGKATLQSLILKNGNVTGTENGGAILIRDGTLTIKNVSFVGNSAYNGGAISTSLYYVHLQISQSEFHSNSAQYSGGAIYIPSRGDLQISQSELLSNSAQYSGGAIYIQRCKLTIQNSILNNNIAGLSGGAIKTSQGDSFLFEENSFVGNTATNSGGAISMESRGSTLIRSNLFSSNSSTLNGGAYFDFLPSSTSLTVENNTFYNNSANNAGAIFVSSTVSLKNNTFSENKATQAQSDTTAASVLLWSPLNATIINNLIANSARGKECVLNGSGQTFINGNNNLVEDGSCSTLPGVIIADPMLGALADNGGPTQTLALLPGSPAIDAGDTASCPATDQRGVTRPQGAKCDIGAYEYMDTTAPTVSSIRRADGDHTLATSVKFTVSFSEPVTGVSTITPFNDFILTTSNVTGASITGVSSSESTGTLWTVTVNTGSGNGTIRLDVPEGATIYDPSGNALRSLPYNQGEEYTIEKPPSPPGKTTLASPSGSLGTRTPTYSWSAVSNSTWYYLWVNGPSGTVIQQWYTAEQAGCPSGTGSCSVTPTTALAAGAHRWWVQTWSEIGTGPWSDPMDFSLAAPGKATLTSPSGSAATNQPAYTWSAVSGSTWYYLWVNGPSGTVIQQWYTAEQAGCPLGTGSCSVTPSGTLGPGAHRWWVQTWNSVGYGLWSDPMDFTVP